MESKPILSLPAYTRAAQYRHYLVGLAGGAPKTISSTAIAKALGINDVVVRKDLAAISGAGKPKVGYITEELTRRIESFLGYDDCMDAVLAGVGRLGQALLFYDNFKSYGLRILAAFDADARLIGTKQAGVPVYAAENLSAFVRRVSVRTGIITAPAEAAQPIADAMVSGGVRGIWNFAPARLSVPEGVAVRQEDMAASLAILTKQMCAIGRKEG